MTPTELADPLTPERMAVIADALSQNDDALALALETGGPPKLWRRPLSFGTFVRIILEQQVSLTSAYATFERLKAATGGPVSPDAVIELGENGLKSAGFSRQKVRYTLTFAENCRSKQFSIRGLRLKTDEAVRSIVTSQLGMGNWTADMVLLLVLCRPDVFPVGDLALVKGIERLDAAAGRPPATSVEARGDLWRPHRSVATRMVWNYYLATQSPGKTPPL